MNEAEWLSCENPSAMLAHLQGKVSDRKLRLFSCACCRSCWLLLTDARSRKAVEVTFPSAYRSATSTALRRAWDHAIQVGVRDFSYPFLAARAADDDEHIRLSPGIMLAGLADKERKAAFAHLLREIAGNPWKPVTLPQGPKVRCPECDGQKFPGFFGSDCLADAFNIELLDRACENCNPNNTSEREWKGWVPGPCPWLTPTVLALARAAYEERLPDGTLDPARLLVLSDALEEVGCTDEAILRHLRGEELCLNCDGVGRWEPYSRCGFCHSNGWILLRGPHVRGCFVIDLILGKN